MTLSKVLPVLLLLLPMVGRAAILPDRTRIIFNADDKASSLKLENQSTSLPYLAYSWIETEQGQKDDSILAALPPIQRLEPEAISQIRIVKQTKASTLPTDRESLFYFNVREIPPTPENGNNHAILQLALQSKLKLFWRPAGLKKTPDAKVEQQLTASQQGSSLVVKNPTPYYITLVFFGKDVLAVFPGYKSTMIAPFASLTLNAGSYNGNAFVLGYMDDYGAMRMLNVRCNGQCVVKAPEEKKR
ncbi:MULTISPECIES: fimbrial biogenesis chaperone [unclassified Pseudocitrobacter]|uniref:fimbrial biogenesis chaperone n=1 Tax=unclassified Pseudocitrobacter TaxID=2638778 RepID=UPI0023E36B84|nr:MULTISPECIES: molecular chaperone [unclassified Pseudocitrobacter]MDF3829999.1 molecular chaperone [Pseudocitrobacter sp. 2023EL-00150]MEC5373888.1 molecular chaperone [Pseudocitrobacter sp. MW920760]